MITRISKPNSQVYDLSSFKTDWKKEISKENKYHTFSQETKQ